MPWYHGPTVLEALDSFEKEKPISDLPLRLPIQDVYKFSNFGDNRRIIAGNISSGKIKVGDELVFYPSGKRTKVTSIESFNTAKDTSAAVRTSCGVHHGRTDLCQPRTNRLTCMRIPRRLSAPGCAPASSGWGNNRLIINKNYILKLGTSHEKVQVEAIHKVIDASDYANQNRRTEIMHHDVAEVTFKLAHPIAFDTSEKFPETSRFVLVDEYEIRGGGIVLESLPDEDAEIREDVFTRNEKWIPPTSPCPCGRRNTTSVPHCS